MASHPRSRRPLSHRPGSALAESLRDRLPELEQAVLTRIHSLADPAKVVDAQYREGLRSAVSAALRYGLTGIEASSSRAEPIPPELVSQARLAARSGIGLEIVLRRYFAGYTLLSDTIVEEAKRGSLDAEQLHHLLRSLSTLFDRLVVIVSEEHRLEAEIKARSHHQRKTEYVEKLLAGELADATALGYELDGWHIAIVAAGGGAEKMLPGLAAALDRRILTASRGEQIVWAWLGGRRRIDSDLVQRFCASHCLRDSSFAIGEPAQGTAGWRLTHRQAVAALPISLREAEAVVRYADVALLASMLQDDVLVASLSNLYLAPLASEPDGGETLRRTARAYFEADRKVSSAAAALGVNRHTVANRVRTIEERLGKPLNACAAEMETALRIREMTSDHPPAAAGSSRK